MADSSFFQTCDQAAVKASRETGVPKDILMAITRTETGRTREGILEPWPWTVNMEGAGKWFDELDQARSYVFSQFKSGARSFDIGCFQINYRWHSDAFRSIDEMFEPLANAMYAANFLRDLYKETGNWKDAVGAYHSRTPKYAARYKKRFDLILASINNKSRTIPEMNYPKETFLGSSEVRPSAVRTGNSYPLLQVGTSTPRGGSLVPLEHRSGEPSFLAVFGG